jgi:hypothetical protein
MKLEPGVLHSFILYLLAAIFALTGLLKISQNKQKLAKTLPWVREFKPATIKFIGFSEFSAALGFAGPSIIGFGDKLTPWAALGTSIIMILAGIYHSRRNEYGALFLNITLLFSSLMILFYNKI